MKNIKQIEEWFLTSLLQHGQTLYQINNYAFYDGNKQLMLPQWTKQWMKSTAIFTLWGKKLEQNEQTVSEINSCSYIMMKKHWTKWRAVLIMIKKQSMESTAILILWWKNIEQNEELFLSW